MGLDVDVKMRFVVKKAEGEICDDGDRMFSFLEKHANSKVLKLGV